MATKIRLQRKGKKGAPLYHIVVADARARRDGKYIERLGNYNPNTNPATITFDVDRAVYWLQTGAQPTDTCRAMLSYKGAVYKNHLLNGVRKGALTPAQVEEKFALWVKEKEAKIQAKIDGLSKGEQDKANARLVAEKAYRETKEAAIAAKLAPAPEVVEEVHVAVDEAVAPEAQTDAAAEAQAEAQPE